MPAIEVIPGRWWIPESVIERMAIALPSGHWVRVRPAMQDGRVVIDEVTISRRSPLQDEYARHPSRSGTPDTEIPIGGPITSEVIRGFNVEFFFRMIQHSVVDAEGQRIWATVNEESIRRLRDNGPTRETLGVVADVYRLAYAVGQPPTKRVEEVFDLPRSTAGRWVALARKQGLLGEAAGPGKAGA